MLVAAGEIPLDGAVRLRATTSAATCGPVSARGERSEAQTTTVVHTKALRITFMTLEKR